MWGMETGGWLRPKKATGELLFCYDWAGISTEMEQADLLLFKNTSFDVLRCQIMIGIAAKEYVTKR